MSRGYRPKCIPPSKMSDKQIHLYEMEKQKAEKIVEYDTLEDTKPKKVVGKSLNGVMTFREIGEELGVSGSRAEHIYKAAMIKLQNNLDKETQQRLMEYLNYIDEESNVEWGDCSEVL